MQLRRRVGGAGPILPTVVPWRLPADATSAATRTVRSAPIIQNGFAVRLATLTARTQASRSSWPRRTTGVLRGFDSTDAIRHARLHFSVEYLQEHRICYSCRLPNEKWTHT